MAVNVDSGTRMDDIPCLFIKVLKKNMHHFLPILPLHKLLLITSLCECVFMCTCVHVCVISYFPQYEHFRWYKRISPTYHNHHHHAI